MTAVPPPHPDVPKEVFDAATELRAKLMKLARAETAFARAADAVRIAIRHGLEAGFNPDEIQAIAAVAGLGRSAARIVTIQIQGETRVAQQQRH